ncbi:MAG: enoyl-CoA hydratase/isomerase family protein [Chitinophagales bacterium]
MDGYVKTDQNNGIATIEFFHPQSNSLPGKILNDLVSAIKQAGDDPNTKIIILRSAGENLPAGKTGVFCAGASFDELIAIKNEKQGLEFFSGFAHVINAMRTCPKFIIGRIHGKCVGGGVGLVAGMDYAIAVDTAEIKLSELAIGIGPFVVGPAVERKIGASAFSQLAIDASSWRNAQWAGRKGLFAEVHPTSEELDKAILQLAEKLSQSNPEAMAEMKKIFWKGTEHWDQLLIERAAISGRLVLSEFTRNAIERFKAKR